ncbi:hypothetical protein UlMin_019646 [Ulmus minor]
MGSFPPLSPELHFPNQEETQTQTQSAIDETTLLNLFKSQHSHLNFFFQNLNLSQTLAFTRTLLDSPGTIFSDTLVLLGVSSGFLSPIDALHGDIGILTSRDVLLVKLVSCTKAKWAFLISMTSVEGNVLAGDMNVHLPLERELCPFNLAPVTSTTIYMVFDDTVAIALMGTRNLTKEQYAANHPAVELGKVSSSRQPKQQSPIEMTLSSAKRRGSYINSFLLQKETRLKFRKLQLVHHLGGGKGINQQH